MPITYQGELLTLASGQTADNTIQGGEQEYKNSKDERFSVKTPVDACELFAELFASRILKEFIRKKLINDDYVSSLIVSDVIQLEDGSYRLIQPIIDCQKLHQIIGTSTFYGSNRSSLWETIAGSNYYAVLNQKKAPSFGLSLILMYSLLLGAHSVHSGNIVVLHNKMHSSTQYARMDWSDAFRNFAHPRNNDNLLYAYENQGPLNYKGYTKNYFLNYKLIPGLFSSMAQHARNLNQHVTESTLKEIVCSALKYIPENLIKEANKTEIAKYFCIESDPTSDSDLFATKMAQTLNQRLNKIAQLQNTVAASETNDLYTSVCIKPQLTLSIDPQLSFPDLLTQWQQQLMQNNNVSPESFFKMELSKLALSFNDYIKDLAKKSDETNIWEHNEGSENMFARFNTKTDGLALHGHAFVPEYREGTIFRNLVSLHPETLGTLRFAPYEPFIEGHANTFPKWAKMQKLATSGHSVFNTLRCIKKGLNYGMEGFMEENLPTLQKTLEEFIQLKSEVEVFLKQSDEKITSNLNSSPFFYPLDDDALDKKTGDQLVTICFEGYDELEPNLLVTRILKNDTYWEKILSSLQKNSFDGREDNFNEKKKKIYEWRKLLESNAILEQQKIAEHSKIIEKLNTQLSESSTKNTELHSKIIEIEQQKTQAIAELTEKNTKILEQKQQDIETKQNTIDEQNTQINTLTKQLATYKTNYDRLQEKNNIISSRTLKVDSLQKKLAKLNLQAQNIEEDKKVKQFVNSMKSKINNYIQDTDNNEITAVNTLQIESIPLIKEMETKLGEHREEWKYILANLTLLVLSLGVGYLIASLINKGLNNRYTFFSVTESEEILEKLKDRTLKLGNQT